MRPPPAACCRVMQKNLFGAREDPRHGNASTARQVRKAGAPPKAAFVWKRPAGEFLILSSRYLAPQWPLTDQRSLFPQMKRIRRLLFSPSSTNPYPRKSGFLQKFNVLANHSHFSQQAGLHSRALKHRNTECAGNAQDSSPAQPCRHRDRQN